MTSPGRPPRWCRWLLATVAPPRDRAALLADLEHDYRHEALRSRASARRWYYRQTLTSVVPLLRRRADSSLSMLRRGARELRLTWRAVRRQPAYALTVMTTMAIGSGAVMAVGGVANATLYQDLPYPNAERLVVLRSFDTLRQASGGISGPDFFDYRDRLSRVTRLAAAEASPVTYRREGDSSRRVEAAAISVEAFDLLGIQPVAGRAFGPEDAAVGGPAVVLVREGFAGLGPGDRISLDGLASTVVGVIPTAVRFPAAEVAIWLPLRIRRETYHRRATILTVVGALGETRLDAARDEVEQVARELRSSYPETNGTRTATLTPLADVVGEPLRRPLALLGAGVFLVLLLAYANAAALMLARSAARQREAAVRAALGASVGAEVFRFVLEGLLVSVGGAALGVGIAAGVWAVVPELMPAGAVEIVDPPFDWTFGLTALAAAAVLGGAVGGMLGYPIARAGARDAWRGRTGGSPHVAAAHRLLVITQIAIAFVLASCAGVLIRSLDQLHRSDPGFRPDGAVTARVDLPDTRYPTGMDRYPAWPEVQRFYDRLSRRLEAAPGIEAVGLGWHHPLATGFQMPYRVTPSDPAEAGGRVTIRGVSPGYLRATGMRLIAGRDLDRTDRFDSPPVALVNEAFAHEAFGLAIDDVVGRRVEVFDRTWEIAGIVADVPPLATGLPASPLILPAIVQMPSEFFSVVVRSDADPALLGRLVAETVAAIDPDLAPYEIVPLAQVVRNSTSRLRVAAALGSFLGGTALLLAAFGILSLLTLTVRLRRREIAIRLALGASPGRVHRRQALGGLRLAVIGVAAGLPVALAASWFLSGLVPATQALTPAAWGAVVVGILAVAAGASYVSTRHAAQVDPQVALRPDDG